MIGFLIICVEILPSNVWLSLMLDIFLEKHFLLVLDKSWRNENDDNCKYFVSIYFHHTFFIYFPYHNFVCKIWLELEHSFMQFNYFLSPNFHLRLTSKPTKLRKMHKLIITIRLIFSKSYHILYLKLTTYH